MILDDIRSHRNAKPFRPFYIHLNDGRRLLVRSPENVGYSPGGKYVGVGQRDAIDTFTTDQIVKLQPAKAPRRKNPGAWK